MSTINTVQVNRDKPGAVMSETSSKNGSLPLCQETVLEVTGLNVAFRRGGGWSPVVKDLSFRVARGETLAIVGESGSGKSVSAMSILGLLPPNTSQVTGSIRLQGQELLNLPEQQMADIRGNRVAMIFQEPMTSLNPVMTIGEQIAEPVRLHRGLDAIQAKEGAGSHSRCTGALRRLPASVLRRDAPTRHDRDGVGL